MSPACAGSHEAHEAKGLTLGCPSSWCPTLALLAYVPGYGEYKEYIARLVQGVPLFCEAQHKAELVRNSDITK